MEIVVTGRHVQVSDRFRQHLDEKLAKVPQLAPRVQRLDVVVTHEPTAASPSHVTGSRSPVTSRARSSGPRPAPTTSTPRWTWPWTSCSNGCGGPTTAATCRTAAGTSPESVGQATAQLVAEAAAVDGEPADATTPDDEPRSRPRATPRSRSARRCTRRRRWRWTRRSTRWSWSGHDFYLFHDADTDRPSVVYRRRGWSYGVIHLDVPTDRGRRRSSRGPPGHRAPRAG